MKKFFLNVFSTLEVSRKALSHATIEDFVYMAQRAVPATIQFRRFLKNWNINLVHKNDG